MSKMRISEVETLKIAGLASIDMDHKDTAYYTRECSRIIEFAAQLDEVDTTGIEPFINPTSGSLQLFEDVIVYGNDEGCNIQDDVLANSKYAKHKHFVVPKVID